MTLLITLGVICFLGATAWTVAADKNNYLKQHQSDLEWLNQAMKELYYIEFELTNTIMHKTSNFLPSNTLAGSEWNMKLTSLHLAELYLRQIGEVGYITSVQGIMYPLHGVKTMVIKKS